MIVGIPKCAKHNQKINEKEAIESLKSQTGSLQKSDSQRASAASGKAGARNTPEKHRAAAPFSKRTWMYASPSAHGWISARITSISFVTIVCRKSIINGQII